MGLWPVASQTPFIFGPRPVTSPSTTEEEEEKEEPPAIHNPTNHPPPTTEEGPAKRNKIYNTHVYPWWAVGTPA